MSRIVQIMWFFDNYRGQKWYYLDVKRLSALLHKIISKSKCT